MSLLRAGDQKSSQPRSISLPGPLSEPGGERQDRGGYQASKAVELGSKKSPLQWCRSGRKVDSSVGVGKSVGVVGQDRSRRTRLPWVATVELFKNGRVPPFGRVKIIPQLVVAPHRRPGVTWALSLGRRVAQKNGSRARKAKRQTRISNKSADMIAPTSTASAPDQRCPSKRPIGASRVVVQWDTLGRRHLFPRS